MSSSIPENTLEKFTTFGDLLRFLRRRAALTQLELSIAVGYSDAQISRLEQNLRPPDIPTIEARFVPALGLEDEPRTVARLLDLAADVRREDAPGLGLCPYKGLNYFDEADAELFVGREGLTAKLVERVLSLAASGETQGRFLAIVGASGSGKSSLVRAGLVPALRWNKKSIDWQIHILTPTAHPLENLAANLAPEDAPVSAVATLMDDLARDPRSLQIFLKRNRDKKDGSHVLLVVDQFEELFALCRSEEERAAFIRSLLCAASEENGPVIVLITLRADFYAYCASYIELRKALAADQDYIGAMSEDELRRAIEEPARRGRWEFEPGLVDLLLHDIGQEPGALPLLSHALLETWQRRRGRVMTLSGYTSSGGVRGAIAETAEAVFADRFTHEQQDAARRIFLRLTELGDETTTGDTRRRASYDELILKPDDNEFSRSLLKVLADARLIVTGENTVEVAHEALIREWPRLRGWLEDNREGLRLHRQLTESAQEWETLNRDADLLYRGARLTQALEWASAHQTEMNEMEQAFLAASRSGAQREAAEREAQRQRELEAAQKLAESEKQRAEEQAQSAAQLNKRARYLTVAFVVALLLAFTALYFGSRARNTAIAAENEKRNTSARELAASSLNNLEIDPERSILLAMQAISTTKRVDGTVLPEAEEALHQAVQASRVQLTLKGHHDIVWAGTFSPDGSRVATASADGTAKVWDADQGEELLTLKGDESAVEAAAFSPDGKLLATGGDNTLIKIWDASTGKELSTLKGHTSIVSWVAFSPDGSRLATACTDGTVKVWHVGTGQELFTLSGHDDFITRVFFSPDGRRLATAGADGIAKVWDASSGQELLVLSGHAGSVYGVAFSPDGKRIATASVDRTARIWDASDGTALLTFYGHADVLTDVAFSPDGTRLATASFDRQAKVWDATTGQELFSLAGHNDQITSVAFSPDGTRILTTSEDGTAKVWSTGPSAEVLTLVNGHASASEAPAWLSYSPDGTRLAASNADPTPKIWDLTTGHVIHELAGHTDVVRGIAFSPDGTKIATGSDDGTAKIWDASTGKELLTLSGHQGLVFYAAFDPGGTRVATASSDGTARIWDARSGKELLTLAGHSLPVTNVAFSPDGTRLATSSVDGTAKVWDAQTGQELLTLTGHTDGIRLVVFSPDGKQIGTASFDGTAKIWDAETGEPLLNLPGHGGTVFGIAFRPDGTQLATASADRTTKIWDAVTGQELLTLYGHSVGVTNLAFSPDGLHLATASYDGTDRIYVLRLEDLIELAKSRLTRQLTPAECQTYLHVDQCPAQP